LLVRDVVIQGATGMLGGALLAAASPPANSRAIKLANSRQIFAAMQSRQNLDLTGFTRSEHGKHLDWICASGLIDPRAPAEQLLAVNDALPMYVLEGLCEAVTQGLVDSARFLTFGSALETRDILASHNNYLMSKNVLWKRWRETAAELPVEWHHIQLHTLYGGTKAVPFMFLGQVESAIRSHVPFRMSSGNQLREYHHVADIAENVMTYLETEQTCARCIDLSSGEPVALATLARAIFERFGLSDLLEIGAIAEDPGEVFSKETRRSPYLRAYREPVEGIIQWLSARDVMSAMP
jgi:hypothetical protein